MVYATMISESMNTISMQAAIPESNNSEIKVVYIYIYIKQSYQIVKIKNSK